MIQHNGSLIENVLILQGGGSLGAFGCGVYKAVVRNNINLDIVAGTSIGGINAAIIAGRKDDEHTQELLENFWLELSESYIDLDNSRMYSYWPKIIGQQLHSYLFPYNSPKLDSTERYFNTRKEQDVKIKQTKSFYSYAIYGNEKMFKPRWSAE